jgi:hypothetical protein
MDVSGHVLRYIYIYLFITYLHIRLLIPGVQDIRQSINIKHFDCVFNFFNNASCKSLLDVR